MAEGTTTTKATLPERARNNPRDVRFTDVLRLVEATGFVPIRQRPGSHRRYVHSRVGEYLTLQPKPDGKAKDYQVKQFLDTLDAHGLGLTVEDDE